MSHNSDLRYSPVLLGSHCQGQNRHSKKHLSASLHHLEDRFTLLSMYENCCLTPSWPSTHQHPCDHRPKQPPTYLLPLISCSLPWLIQVDFCLFGFLRFLKLCLTFPMKSLYSWFGLNLTFHSRHNEVSTVMEMYVSLPWIPLADLRTSASFGNKTLVPRSQQYILRCSHWRLCRMTEMLNIRKRSSQCIQGKDETKQ